MKRFRKLLMLFAMMLMAAFGSSVTASADVKIPAIKPGEPITPVKTLAWSAKLRVGARYQIRQKVKVKVKDKNGKVHYKYKYVKKTYRLKSGSKVKVVKVGSPCTIEVKGRKFRISRSYLSLTKALVTSVTEGDYNTSTKLHFINRKKRPAGSSKYFIWVSLDKQRVNVYMGKNKKWKLIRVMKCSTGVGAATPTGTFRIDFKEPVFDYLTNYLEVCGSGFHMWPGMYPNKKQHLGKDVASHGCIRLYYKDSAWMFKNIPVGTYVLIY